MPTYKNGILNFPIDSKDHLEQNQADSSVNPLELEGCLNIVSDVPSSGSFDDNVEIEFSRPLLESPAPPNLQFMDQTTPQSQIVVRDMSSASTNPSKQG